MNLLMNVLFATAVIAGLILLRMFADRRALRLKIRKGQTDADCGQAGCFRSCEPDSTAADSTSAAEEQPSRRSAYHAP